MREYDRNKPLIAIHIPKTAGTSVRAIMKKWYGDNLLLNYYVEATATMPEKYDIAALHSWQNPVVVYGHFNRTRNFGIEHYYPQVKQFITILRDPFERVVSAYFYMHKNIGDWLGNSRAPFGDLRKHLLKSRGNMLNHFPEKVTMENFRNIIDSRFIEVGLMEYLDESMHRIATKLGQKYTTGDIPHLNHAKKTTDIPYEIKQEFMQQHQLEYAVYHYVLSRYESTVTAKNK
ncbi:MAG TPA: hypothetical protein ENJ41_00990 [Oceanospirillales bacterium]|nr:hypothetical protein [Oceanospirillales bacterium]